MLTPAKQLAGKTLEGGWRVLAPVTLTNNSTGGCFSEGYIVESKEGTKAFLKALDYSRALASADPARALQAMTSAYNFERDLLNKCKSKGMDRVVRAITDGKIVLSNAGTSVVVEYLIFELADGDVRKYFDKTKKFDDAWVLRVLHHVATGLKQLHSEGIAHQDLKPSNVLVFEGNISKVADLGRAAHKGYNPPHENFRIAGDPSYAPLELLYGYVDPEWNRRRLGCDMYLLGSMVVFFFTGLSITSLIISEMLLEHRPKSWSGSFEDVLPYLRDAFGRVIDDFSNKIENVEIRTDLTNTVRELCEIDPRRRGHPKNLKSASTQHSLERYVTRFDVLARKAEMSIFR